MMNIKSIMNSDKFSGAKIVAILLLCLAPLLFNNNVANAAAGDSVINSVSCPAATAPETSGQINFASACTVNITRDIADGNLQLQIRVISDTTTAGIGNGGNLDITTPSNRFSANLNDVTLAGGAITVQTGIAGSGDQTLNLKYITWEADIGETDYTQNFELQLLDSVGTPVTQGWYSTNTNMTFTTKRVMEIVSTTATAAIDNLTQYSDMVPVQYHDSDNILVEFKVNDTWKLELEIEQQPTSGGDTLPLGAGTSAFYYICPASGSYTSNASSRTEITAASTKYSVSESNSATTGGTATSLSTITVTLNYSLKTLKLFAPGDYSIGATGSTFTLTSPKP